MQYRSLVFVYRTDANPVSLAAEFIRELQGDDEYECSLCHLTYGRVRKKPEWTRFTKGLPLDARFHLRSTFVRRHPELDDRTYPMVFIEDSDEVLHDFLDADELRACDTVEELIAAVQQRLDAISARPLPTDS